MEMEQYEIDHLNRVRKLAPECMVLLKSDGSFPLAGPEKIALYGSGARRTLKGGRGSGDVNVRAFTTVEQGLLNAGFEVTTDDWLVAYEKAWQKAREPFKAWLKKKIAAEGMDTLMENLSIVMPEPEYDIPLTGQGTTAIYVLSRLCGEGVDRQALPGDLFLSQTEIRDILTLQQQYQKFMLVLNTACVVDLSPVAGLVDNILLLSQPGMTVGDSFADVLLGKAYPSGKLAVTWAAWEDYCKVGEFGHREDTRYTEGVYVGYRYFDTVGKTPIFPFGHGLGYTSFALEAQAPRVCGTRISMTVQVANTGNFPGKEVVQLYVSVPQGRLDQPAQVLTAFEKTRELAPGAKENVELSFDMESLSSFDTQMSARVLASGVYILRVGNSSRSTITAGAVCLDQTIVTEYVAHVGGTPDFEDWRPSKEERTRLALEAEKAMQALETEIKTSVWQDGQSASGRCLQLPSDAFTPVQHRAGAAGDDGSAPAKQHTTPLDQEACALVKKLSDEELIYLCTGDFVDEGSKSVIGDSAITVAGAAGETTGRFKAYGVDNLIMADGPAGLRLSREYGVDAHGIFTIEAEAEEDKMELLPEPIKQALLSMFPVLEKPERTGELHHQYCTAIPVAASMAQSWDPAVAKSCGELVAEEMKRFGIQIWLAPAMNIQRNPLCGRNFEYYSEDPLISGRMAAGMTLGVQKDPGQCVTIKHFICNNQEANRFRTSSMVSERALRDIYARGFEIVVKEARPMALMTSYNLLNGIHPSERRELLETMLRQEWGFDGIIMSDFLPGDETESDRTNKYAKFQSVASVKAGLDLLMPGGKAHYENLLGGLAQGELSRDDLEKCAARMVAFAWRLKGRRA